MSDVDFPKLVEDYQDALFRFALRLTANDHDAEEIAQEAFVRAFRWLQANPWILERPRRR